MPQQTPLKIAVLVSGSGTNLQALIDCIEQGDINASIACVISNKAEALALSRARQHGIPTEVLESSAGQKRSEYDALLVKILHRYDVKLVVLAGFMRILTDVMISAFPNAIMNIHPALLPAFPGLNAQRQALEYGVRFTGCTVHFVDSGTDTGPIILQAVVPITAEDTVATISEKIQVEEHRIYPEAVRLFVQGSLKVEERRVKIQLA